MDRKAIIDSNIEILKWMAESSDNLAFATVGTSLRISEAGFLQYEDSLDKWESSYKLKHILNGKIGLTKVKKRKLVSWQDVMVQLIETEQVPPNVKRVDGKNVLGAGFSIPPDFHKVEYYVEVDQ